MPLLIAREACRLLHHLVLHKVVFAAKTAWLAFAICHTAKGRQKCVCRQHGSSELLLAAKEVAGEDDEARAEEQEPAADEAAEVTGPISLITYTPDGKRSTPATMGDSSLCFSKPVSFGAQ